MGRVTEETGIAPYRALSAYLGDKRWVTENVAQRLRKPTRLETPAEAGSPKLGPVL